LRQTVATQIAERLGVGGEQLLKRVLGNSDVSVTVSYNPYAYLKEMRVVPEQWTRDPTARQLTDAHRSAGCRIAHLQPTPSG
jgi:hypothetical protein